MQITTITFLHYRGLRNKIWGFGMMQFAHRELGGVMGQQFYKLMGSGKGQGFNPFPDWSTYCLLQIWESEQQADRFFQSSKLVEKYKNRTGRMRIFYMKNIMAKGAWSGSNPFIASSELDTRDMKLAIITRATIKWTKLWKFWAYVPTAQKHLASMPGLIYTKGLGEVPIIQMATFSIWENKKALQAFAYQSEEHKTAIRMTRKLNWYKEELFARFQVFREKDFLASKD